MADILGAKTQAVNERKNLRGEGGAQADDLLGRLNAMDFIDSVLGEDADLPGTIGDFEITGVLGRGGMGTVYKAYQETLDREVALKVLAPRFSSDPTMRTRFRNEARDTAAMHHQHIVPIYGYGEASGHLFFAMEMVKGVSLDKHISVARRKGEGALDPIDAARRFSGIADALALAHRRKILHRDVKPGNILVHEDGTMALADFGLSKFLGEVSVQLTSASGFLGTLHYSPPEQARGGELGKASDLYSLGVTIFEAVTGKLPLFGDSTESMLNALINEEPKRLRHYLPKASRDLDAVLDKLLQKNVSDRYQDAESVAFDLMRVAEGEPIRIRRTGPIRRLYRRARRKPMRSTAILVGIALLVVSLFWFNTNKNLTGLKHLANARIAIAKEPGAALGPGRILDALIGTGVDAGAKQASSFLFHVEQARKRLPDERSRLDRFRTAYAGAVLEKGQGDGAIDSVGLLKGGFGRRAADAITVQINRIRDQFGTHDLDVRIDLYNLYLARGLTWFTVAVGDRKRAASDLDFAGFMRSGAFLPKMLKVFSAWDEGESAAKLIDSLKVFVEGDSFVAAEKRITAQFLLAFAGICAPADSHMQPVGSRHSVRKELTDQALLWLGTQAKRGVEGQYLGLDLLLCKLAANVLTHRGDETARASSLAEAKSLLSVAASPLQSWAYTFSLLVDDEAIAPPTDVMRRLRGAIDFVRLVMGRSIEDGRGVLLPQGEVLGELCAEPEVATALVDDAERRLRIELRARLGSWVDANEIALVDANVWRELESDSPDAIEASFRGLVRKGPATDDEALAIFFRANAAIERALDKRAMWQRMIAWIDAHLLSTGPVEAAEKARLSGIRDELRKRLGNKEGV